MTMTTRQTSVPTDLDHFEGRIANDVDVASDIGALGGPATGVRNPMAAGSAWHPPPTW